MFRLHVFDFGGLGPRNSHWEASWGREVGSGPHTKLWIRLAFLGVPFLLLAPGPNPRNSWEKRQSHIRNWRNRLFLHPKWDPEIPAMASLWIAKIPDMLFSRLHQRYRCLFQFLRRKNPAIFQIWSDADQPNLTYAFCEIVNLAGAHDAIFLMIKESKK